MKILMSSMLILAASTTSLPAAVGTIIEDFESYSPGTILGSGNGWTAGTGAQIVVGVDGTRSVQDDSDGGTIFNGQRVAPTTALGSSYTGPAHLAVTAVPVEAFYGQVVYTRYGLRAGLGGLLGSSIGFTEGGTNNDGKGSFFLYANDQSGSPWHIGTELIDAGKVYDLVLNMDIISQTQATGTLYYRNVTDGGSWVTSSIANVNLDATVAVNPTNIDTININGSYVGQLDNLAFGAGHVAVPEPSAAITVFVAAGMLIGKRRAA